MWLEVVCAGTAIGLQRVCGLAFALDRAQPLVEQHVRRDRQQHGVIDVERLVVVGEILVREDLRPPAAAIGVKRKADLDRANLPGLAGQTRVVGEADEIDIVVQRRDRLVEQGLIATGQSGVDDAPRCHLTSVDACRSANWSRSKTVLW